MRRTSDPPYVVASVLEQSAERMARTLGQTPRECGLVELRCDHLRREEIVSLVRCSGRPTIVTIRRREEGGAFSGSEEERREAILAALEAGARYVDVEWQSGLADLALHPELRSRVIVSHHGGPCRLEALVDLVGQMAKPGVAALKVVPDARSVDDVLAIRDLLRRPRLGSSPLAAFALGRAGATSRILGPSWGSWATYGAAARGRPTAPGQFDAHDLLQLHDVLGISARTRLYGLVGRDLSASPSAAMHNAGYRSVGLDARYLPIETEEIDPLCRLLASGAGLQFEALGVTIPHKETIAARCRASDERVARCGAVNTVLIRADGWFGLNTDGPAALELVRQHCEPRGSRVAILGAGGTARSIAVSLLEAGADVVLFNRTPDRAATAARQIGAQAATLEDLTGHEWDILVQATPRGADGGRFFDPGSLRGRLVLDAVYAASPTALIRDAQARGLASEDGLALLVKQGVAQFRHMTGRSIESGVLRAAAVQWLSPRLP